MFDYVWSEKFKFLVSEKAAGEADKNTEVNDLNETAAEEEECSSIINTFDKRLECSEASPRLASTRMVL